jgi:hypothetical protein
MIPFGDTETSHGFHYHYFFLGRQKTVVPYPHSATVFCVGRLSFTVSKQGHPKTVSRSRPARVEVAHGQRATLD